MYVLHDVNKRGCEGAGGRWTRRKGGRSVEREREEVPGVVQSPQVEH